MSDLIAQEKSQSGLTSTVPSIRSEKNETRHEGDFPVEAAVLGDALEDLSSEAVGNTRSIKGFKWFLVCTSLYLSCLIYGLDTTIAADIQGAVLSTFEVVGQLTWLGTGFPMASLCAILPVAALYAVFDLKVLFISSVVLFEVGSAVCGAAPTMDALIVGRVIAGLGGSGIYIGILNYLTMCTTHAERGLYIGGVGFAWGMGAILGPVVGGAFSTSSATWRWSFYINLLVAAVCAPIFFIYLPSLHATAITSSVLSRLSKIDWLGILLSTATIVTFVMALTFAGTEWAWNDGRTITMFVVFGVLVVLTVIQQYFALLTTRETRMFPTSRLLRSKSQILLYIGTFCAVANLFMPLYYIPVYFQFVHGDTSLMAAVRLLPFVLLLVSTNLASGYFLPKIGYYSILYLATGILLTTGTALMYTVKVDSPPSHVYGYSVLLAIGAGLTCNTGYPIASIKASLEGGTTQEINSVISLQNTCTVGGSVIILLISGQIFQSLAFANLKTVLAGTGLDDAEVRSLVGGVGSAVFQGLDDQLRKDAVQAITSAISKVYVLGIATAGLTLVGSLLMKRERLFKSVEAGPASGGESAEMK